MIKLNKMEEMYYWIGLVVFWLCSIIGVVLIVGYLCKILLDELGKRFKTMWIFVEYAIYRSDYKKWVKDKKRHKKLES